MSQFAPAPYKPDSRVFASYPMPAKIDLINERPRRESVVEKHLENKIGEPNKVPEIKVSEQHSGTSTNQAYLINQQQEEGINYNRNDHQQTYNQLPRQSHNQSQQQNMVQTQHYSTNFTAPNQEQKRTTTTTTTTMKSNNAAIFAAELADKEAKLMADINALHQRPYSPFQVPDKIDLTNERRIAQQQFEHAPSPRPFSRASSTRSTSADLLDKEAKLMQEIEEMEKKPYNPQRMVVEREQWFEYPEGDPYNRQLTDSKRRVKDFCSLPSYMYPNQGTHVHEENLPTSLTNKPSSSASSIHTAIIRSPRREVDNSSPLPFAFDNFSTKGVRGNIASVGAFEPERPRPPIYPIIKRTPSPNMARG